MGKAVLDHLWVVDTSPLLLPHSTSSLRLWAPHIHHHIHFSLPIYSFGLISLMDTSSPPTPSTDHAILERISNALLRRYHRRIRRSRGFSNAYLMEGFGQDLGAHASVLWGGVLVAWPTPGVRPISQPFRRVILSLLYLAEALLPPSRTTPHTHGCDAWLPFFGPINAAITHPPHRSPAFLVPFLLQYLTISDDSTTNGLVSSTSIQRAITHTAAPRRSPPTSHSFLYFGPSTILPPLIDRYLARTDSVSDVLTTAGFSSVRATKTPPPRLDSVPF